MPDQSDDPTSNEVNGFTLLASALTTNTEESRLTRLENQTTFRWFVTLFIAASVSQTAIIVILAIFYVPMQIAKGIAVNQSQNVVLESDRNDLGKLTRARMEELGQLRGIPQ